jgi:hypothetical protein
MHFAPAIDDSSTEPNPSWRALWGCLLRRGLAGMHCYFMRDGNIVGDQALTVESDEEAVEQARALFAVQMGTDPVDGFEVWDRTRVVARAIGARWRPGTQTMNPRFGLC